MSHRVPMTFDDDWWIDDFQNYGGRPCSRSRFSDSHMNYSRFMDNHFPHHNETRSSVRSSFSPIKNDSIPGSSHFRTESSGHRKYVGNTSNRGFAVGCTLSDENDNYEILLDVQQFNPNELSVRTADNYIVVEGKHEERPDDHGFISRQFKKRYPIPQNHLANDVESSLSSDGILKITVPKIQIAPEKTERIVHITQVGPLAGMETRSKSAQRERCEDDDGPSKVYSIPVSLNSL